MQDEAMANMNSLTFQIFNDANFTCDDLCSSSTNVRSFYHADLTLSILLIEESIDTFTNILPSRQLYTKSTLKAWIWTTCSAGEGEGEGEVEEASGNFL